VPEDRRIFPKLTVRENLQFAALHSRRGGPQRWAVERVMEEFPLLKVLAR